MSESEEKRSKWSELKENRAFRWTRDFMFFAVVLGSVMWWQTRGHVISGEPAPELQLGALAGEPFDLAASDKPTVVFFWAPWCSVCHADAHNIDAVREAVGEDANVVSVALSYESLDDVQGFVDKHGVTSPVLLGNRRVTDDWRVQAFPTIYIVNSKAEVAYSMVGYTTEIGLRLRLATLGVF